MRMKILGIGAERSGLLSTESRSLLRYIGEDDMRTKLTEDERFMKEAVKQAKKAWKIEEVPIGLSLIHI